MDNLNTHSIASLYATFLPQYARSLAERLARFNKQNSPFYIVDHENGQYSLCLPFSLVSEKYKDYGQEAFNRYAEEIGDPVMENGLYTHGSGYEWESVFMKAFESDDNIRRIRFDCEAGGFFCYADDLGLLEDFGSRFKAVCEETSLNFIGQTLTFGEYMRGEFECETEDPDERIEKIKL